MRKGGKNGISLVAVLGIMALAVYVLTYGLPWSLMTVDLSGRPITALRIAGNEG